MQVVIVGVKKTEYKGKDGQNKVGFNYCGMKDYTRYEQENADCEGQDVIKEFSNIDFSIHPGDTVEFVYEPGFQDKATLVDVKVLAIADKPPFKNDAAPAAAGQKSADGKPEEQKAK